MTRGDGNRDAYPDHLSRDYIKDRSQLKYIKA